MGANYDPKYDTDQVTFGYLKKVLGEDNIKAANTKTDDIQFCKNYGSTPIPPYNIGDTWTTPTKVYNCIRARKMGSFSIDDWVVVYDKETNTAISNSLQFLSSVELVESPDNKIETFYMENEPSENWKTAEEKNNHLGDYYQNSQDFKTYKYVLKDNEYKWEEIKVTTIIFNASTTHKNIFLKRPSTYEEGDIWRVNNIDDVALLKDAEIGDFFKSTKNNQLFTETDWEKITNELSLKGNIYSSAGIQVSGDNLLANLQYTSTGLYNGYSLLGFNKYFTVTGTVKNYSDIAIDIDLPDNFKVMSAYLSLYHTPVYWSYYNENSQAVGENWGYSRNLKLYKIKNENNFKLFMAFANEYRYEFNSSDMEEIVNAFKSTSYTPTNQSGTSIVRKDTINLKSYLNEIGKTKLIIRSGNSVPNDDADITKQTGMARVIVNVLGYINAKEG